MDSLLIKQIIEFIENVDYVIIATCDQQGYPHLTTASRLRYDVENHFVHVAEWFCKRTVANLDVKKHISIVAWEPKMDVGYQLQGTVIEIQNNAILDGYAEKEVDQDIPQARYELVIQVERISEFTYTFHSDENLMNVLKGTSR